MKTKSLLIGNGFNRCIKGGIPWGDLLSKIAAEYEVDYHAGIPMPLEFERIINEYQKKCSSPKAGVYNETKEKVAALIKGSSPDCKIYKELKSLHPDNIITTNYDLLLEQSYDSHFAPKINKGPRGTRYIEKSVGQISGINFYHAHGCVDEPQTICLGYEHYIGIVTKIKENISVKRMDTNERVIQKILFGKEPPKNTWAELFFTSDIDIMGLSLDANESDLWWLLTYRACFYYNNYNDIRSRLTNRIVYHDVIDDLPKAEAENEEKRKANIKKKEEKYRLLEGTHVEVNKYKLSEYGTYEDAYIAMLSNVKASWQ